MAQRITMINKRLFNEAKRHLVGGVDSPVRSFKYVGGDPVLIDRGSGSRIYDHDGNEYIDYALSFGAVILGHNHRAVTNAVKRRANRGLAFGATHTAEIRLASAIKGAIPFMDKVRFVNSGTEAVMGAVRLARGYTGRDKIVKFENSYHGHADYLLAKGGSGLATLGIPSSAGVPKDFTKHTIVAPINDIETLESIFRRSGKNIAAALIEPVGGNYGVVPPDINFLKRLKKLTARYGSLLIFDEVISGFRFGFGSAAQRFGIIPDLVVLGKIIGGGLPIGAYGGRERIMRHLAPSGNVYQASTFAGNPIVTEAGAATLKALKVLKNNYKELEELTKYLVVNAWRSAGKYNIALEINSYGSMFSLKFVNKNVFRTFYRTLLDNGVYLAPSEFEANFVSFAHTKKDIDKTIKAVDAALRSIKYDTGKDRLR
jgi:glutamate-1-semialdehyde 2,1-aminomutase